MVFIEKPKVDHSYHITEMENMDSIIEKVNEKDNVEVN